MVVKDSALLIDSNILIYSADPAYEELRKLLNQNQLYVSQISRLEVLGYNKLKNDDRRYFNAFFSFCHILNISTNVIDEAIRLRKLKSISIGDCIIAATAVIGNYPLLTGNTKDFHHLAEIDLIDLSEI